MIITIDGPAGAGKSTAAKTLAGRLGFEYLDTGAMYRAVALAAVESDCNINDENALRHLLDTIQLEVRHGRVLLNGRDVGDLIRNDSVSEASSAIAKIPSVRQFLVDMQRSITMGRDFVTEGRDQGTVVFPNADCKFFLIADAQERARRRFHELIARDQQIAYDDVLRAQKARDQHDASRTIAPLLAADDATVVDSTILTLEQVVDRMEQEINKRQS